MSGGVDSSVAAALLVDAGHDVVGVSMQLHDASQGNEHVGSCCTIDDLHDARRVAHALGIPHYIVNLARRFEATVVANFVREYAGGERPSRARTATASSSSPRSSSRLPDSAPARWRPATMPA